MKRTVLVADDDRSIRSLLKERFTEDGYDVILAKDGEEAINRLNKNIQVALIDINMPIKDGMAFLRHIQDKDITIQVIMLTGDKNVQNAVEAMKSGAYDYVTKPINIDLVNKTVRNAFSAYKTHMEYSELKEQVEKLSKYPEENPNPVIRVNKKTIVEYCNNSARLLLQEYGCRLNKEISGLFLEVVRDVFKSREIKSIQVQAASDFYLMTFVPVPDADYINIYGYKINELIEKEKDLNQNKKLLQAITRAQTQYIEDVIPRLLFDELLLNLLSLTNSEYGFIGEILYTPEKIPYLKTHAITNIAWNDETRKFYDENAPKGMEFHNLKTLFGEVMVTGKPVISNMPGEDPRRGGLPEGHPPLNAFLGIPFYKAGRLVGMVGISNRQGGYDKDLITYLNPFLFTCANIIDAYRIDRRRIETDKALKEGDARIRAVLNNVVDGIISINEKGIVESYNPAAARIFGYSLEEALGKNVKMLMPEEYRNKHDGFIADYLKTGKARIIGIGREVKGMRKDGTIFPIDLAVSEVKLEGKRIFSGIVRDITERKKYEEKQAQLLNQLSVIINSVGDAIVVTDKELRINTVNPVFLELIEDIESNVIGKMVNDVVQRVDDDGRININMNSHLEETVTKGITTESRSRIKISEGRTIVIGSINSPLKDSEGNIIGVILSIRDISKDVELDRLKTEFISTVSHELRTPLTSIKGYVDVILDGDTGEINEQQREFLEIVYQNSDRLNKLIDDLLDVERIESGKIRMKFSHVSLTEIVSSAVKTMESAAVKKGLIMKSRIKEDVEFSGDRDKIIQMVINLISNAVKYTEKGNITIVLKSAKQTAEIIVRDTGIGIRKIDQKKLFDKFFRASNEYSQSGGGTGLGLSIVKAIVENHGAQIKIKSQINKGSEFKVVFPLAKKN